MPPLLPERKRASIVSSTCRSKTCQNMPASLIDRFAQTCTRPLPMLGQSETCQNMSALRLELRVIICLEKLFHFFCDFDMILLWFCYGFLMVDFMFFFACPENSYDFDMVLLWSWSASLFACEICYGWSYLFCKKNIWSCFGHFRMEKNINYLY